MPDKNPDEDATAEKESNSPVKDSEETEIIRDFKDRWKKHAVESNNAPKKPQKKRKSKRNMDELLETEREKLYSALPEIEKKLKIDTSEIDAMKLKLEEAKNIGNHEEIESIKRDIISRLKQVKPRIQIDASELEALDKDLRTQEGVHPPPKKIPISDVNKAPKKQIKFKPETDALDVSKMLYEKEYEKTEEVRHKSLDNALQREMQFIQEDLLKEPIPPKETPPPVAKEEPTVDIKPDTQPAGISVTSEPPLTTKSSQLPLVPMQSPITERMDKPRPVKISDLSERIPVTAGLVSSQYLGTESLKTKTRNLNPIVGIINGAKIKGVINNTGAITGTYGDYYGLSGTVTPYGRLDGLISNQSKLSGRINGNGRVNGLINGRRVRGWINSAGLSREHYINFQDYSNGVINGRGYVNGGSSSPSTLRLKNRKSKAFETIAVFSVVIFFITLAFILYMPPGPQPGIVIDSNFDDWKDSKMVFNQASRKINPDVDLVQCRLDDNYNKLGFYIEVRGTWFTGSDNHPDAVHIFLDTDLNLQTGYKVKGIGADYMIQAYGVDGSVVSSELFIYDNSGDPTGFNWNYWQHYGTVRSGVSSGKLETQIFPESLGLRKVKQIEAIAHTLGWNGDESWSMVFGNKQGVLVVKQVSTGAQTVPVSGTIKMLSLSLTTGGSEVRIRAINLTKAGNASIDSIIVGNERFSVTNGRANISPINIIVKRNDSTLMDIYTDLSGASPNSSVGFRIADRKDIWVDNATVTITNELTDYVAYVGGPPASVVVDSAFGEWQKAKNDLIGNVFNKNIDITRFGAAVLSGSPIFYIRVLGTMLDGAAVPWKPPVITSAVHVTVVPDTDRDTMNDSIDLFLRDFNNDGLNDSDTIGNHNGIFGLDVDGDGITDYPQGPDLWLNCTLPNWPSLPPGFAGKIVSVYVGPSLHQHPKTISGQDVISIYIDYDNDSTTGYPVMGTGAEYMINISGRDGNIQGCGLYRYDIAEKTDQRFILLDSTISLGKDTQQIELSTSREKLNLSGNSSIVVVIRDWEGEADYSGKDLSPLVQIDPFVAAGNGNTFISNDGTVWTPKTAIGSATITDITVDSIGNYYALSTNGRNWKSMDSGTTWVEKVDIGAGTNYDSIFWCNDYLYAVTTAGVTYMWDTVTEPATWTVNTINPPGGTYVGVTAIQSGLYAGVYIIRNSGQTYKNLLGLNGNWQNTGDSGNQNDYTDMTSYSSILYVLDDNGPIRVSVNGGYSWTTLNLPNSNNNLYVRVEVDPFTGTMWALRSNGLIYRSINGGASWVNTGDVGGQTNYYGLAAIPEFARTIRLVLPVLIPLLVLSILLFYGGKNKPSRRLKKRIRNKSTIIDQPVHDNKHEYINST